MILPKPLWSRHLLTKPIRDYNSSIGKYNFENTDSTSLSQLITTIINHPNEIVSKKISRLKLLRIAVIKINDKDEFLLQTSLVDQLIALLEEKDSDETKQSNIVQLARQLDLEAKSKIENLSERAIMRQSLVKVFTENDHFHVGYASLALAAAGKTAGKAAINFKVRSIVLQQNSSDNAIDISVGADAHEVVNQEQIIKSSADAISFAPVIGPSKTPLATTITEFKLIANPSKDETQLKVDRHHEIMRSQELDNLIPKLKPTWWENLKTKFLTLFFKPNKKIYHEPPMLRDADDKIILNALKCNKTIAMNSNEPPQKHLQNEEISSPDKSKISQNKFAAKNDLPDDSDSQQHSKTLII